MVGSSWSPLCLLLHHSGLYDCRVACRRAVRGGTQQAGQALFSAALAPIPLHIPTPCTVSSRSDSALPGKTLTRGWWGQNHSECYSVDVRMAESKSWEANLHSAPWDHLHAPTPLPLMRPQWPTARPTAEGRAVKLERREEQGKEKRVLAAEAEREREPEEEKCETPVGRRPLVLW